MGVTVGVLVAVGAGAKDWPVALAPAATSRNGVNDPASESAMRKDSTASGSAPITWQSV